MDSGKKRKLYLLLLAVLLAGLTGGIYYGLQYLYIASSYATKTVCSCHFISGRELDNIVKEDLYAVPYANVSIDEEEQTVTSNIYGVATTRAVYRKGQGCTLVNGATVEELKQQKYENRRAPVAPDLPRGTLSNYFDSVRLLAVMNDIFEEDNGSHLQTRAVVILKDGKRIYERYAQGITRDTPLIGWSMTKSVTNAMVGLLVADGKLKVHQPAPLAEWQDDERKNITIDQLLRMSSGLEFEEDYSSPSDATEMLFRARSAGEVAIDSKLAYPPDEVFSYSSGTTNILQEIIRRQFETLKEYRAFPYERLFDKLGMTSVVLEPDASGTFVGSSFMFATALDWARFGQLYLQDGVWNGERILPEGWAKYSGTESPNSNGVYGAHFWVNHNNRKFPRDAFYADGFEGQFVTILPSQNMVVVRLGCTYGQSFDNIAFTVRILSSMKEQGSSLANTVAQP